MTEPLPLSSRQIRRWVASLLVVYTLMGLGFGSWLSRLPAVRDHLGATTVEMSIYGLCLAIGCVVGLLTSGRSVSWAGPKQALIIGAIVQTVGLPAAAGLIWIGALVPGLALLFIYGFAFSTSDVAMNVSGAGAERAQGRPRLPLFHAGYSLGGVCALGIGAAAELLGVSVPLHFSVIFASILITMVVVSRWIPGSSNIEAPVAGAGDAHPHGHGSPIEGATSGEVVADLVRDQDPAAVERSDDHAFADGIFTDHTLADQSFAEDLPTETGAIPIITGLDGQQPAFSVMTGAIPIITGAIPTVPVASNEAETAQVPVSEPAAAQGQTSGPTVAKQQARAYNPWRDKRILLVGLIALSTSIAEGTASDWLPLALVDGRGLSNENGALMLGVFFIAMMSARVAGSYVITRFGRVATIRGSALLCALGVMAVIIVPSPIGMVLGTIAWGLGSSLGFPIGISAAADNPKTAIRDVAVVSAIAYTAMLLGPMAFGFLGEHIGLLTSFWVLIGVALVGGLVASAAREPGTTTTLR